MSTPTLTASRDLTGNLAATGRAQYRQALHNQWYAQAYRLVAEHTPGVDVVAVLGDMLDELARLDAGAPA